MMDGPIDGPIDGPRRALRRALPWALVLFGYALSRFFYASLGLRLDDSSLAYFWQFQDPVQLRDHLFEALYYQHTQPPLYNLYLAIGLRAPSPEAFFHTTAVGFGLLLHLGLFALMRRLGVRAWLAVLGALLFAWSPASILCELWVFYTYPVAALVVASAVLLHRAVSRERAAAIAFAFFVLAIVVLTRSLFHLVWLAGVALLVLAFVRKRWRAVGAIALPFLLATSLYAKNYFVFGRFEASTWLGFSVSRLITTRAPRPLLAEMARNHEISPLAFSLPWWPLERYPREFRELPPDMPRVPVLTESRRANGNPSFNHGAFVHIARTFLDDAKAVHARDPSIWQDSARRAWQIHFLPIHDYTFFHRARRDAGPPMRAVERFYERLAGSGFVDWDWGEEFPPFEDRPGWSWALMTGLAILFALVYAWRRRGARARAATLVFCAATIAFVAVVGNSLELGENQRFRFLSEPLTVALVFFALDRGIAFGDALLRELRGLRALRD